MPRRGSLVAALCTTLLFFGCLLHAATAEAAESDKSPEHPAIVPRDKLSDRFWAASHAAILSAVHCNPDAQLIFVGDSITQNYEKSEPPAEDFAPIWWRFYGDRQALNLGVSGDTTANVLWRLDHGEVDGIHPKVAVVLIGTNNTGFFHEDAAETALGVDAVVASLERKLPQTKILLLGILPNELGANIVQADETVNDYLARRYAFDDRVTYLDVGPVFRRAEKVDTSLFYDPRLYGAKALHPDTRGQQLMAAAIEPALTRLLGDAARQYLWSLAPNSAVIAAPGFKPSVDMWRVQHLRFLSAEKNVQPGVVLIGDESVQSWSGRAFGAGDMLNLGIAGDRTQNVLWRIEQGELNGIAPQSIVVSVGNNNLSGNADAPQNTPEEIADGVLAVYRAVRKRLPRARIIVTALFPQGPIPCSPVREPIREVNALVGAALGKAPNTAFVDAGSQFLASDGTLRSAEIDAAGHLTALGYQAWRKALLDAGIETQS